MILVNRHPLEVGDQLEIGTFLDYVEAGYRWEFTPPYGCAIRIVGEETIFGQWVVKDREWDMVAEKWVDVDAEFYMSNGEHSTLENLTPIPRNTLVEIVQSWPDEEEE